MKKEITAFIPSLGAGGAQGVFVTVMNYYVSLGYKVKVVVGTLHNDVYSHDLAEGIEIIELNARSAKQSLFRIIDYVKRNNVELAFAFSPEWAVNLAIARDLSKKSFVILGRCINTLSYEYKNAEGFFRRVVSYRLIKMYYRKVDRVIAQASRMKDDLVENFGLRPEQVTVINNPLSDKYVKELQTPAENEREDYLIFVGRFARQKGLDMLFEAFSRIADKSVKLQLFGKGSMEQQLMDHARELGIEDRVEIHPFDKQIENKFRKARLTVMSSIFEGFPNVLTESMACGTPVVSYDLPSGPKEIVIDGVNGYLADYMDIGDLSKKIDDALNTDWDYLAVKKSVERFSMECILPQYKKLIDEWSFI